MNTIFRIFLTISSVSFFGILYFLNTENKLIRDYTNSWGWCIYLVIMMPFAFTLFSLFLCKFCLKDEDSIKKIISIEIANNDFLTHYLAFFFVALSVDNLDIFIIVFSLTVLFTFFSRVSYFNPIFLVCRFNFYYITTDDNVKIMLISRERLKKSKDFKETIVKRINDYTFIEI